MPLSAFPVSGFTYEGTKARVSTGSLKRIVWRALCSFAELIAMAGLKKALRLRGAYPNQRRFPETGSRVLLGHRSSPSCRLYRKT
ncbi:hypothetical protein KCP75_00900 [Salmonella enterica subsp. enterica]|nr:hypothetical protein KCP75_00900 [Salmonella enterica subsp. enterica]